MSRPVSVGGWLRDQHAISNEPFPDILVELKVNDVIANGVRLPRWGWKVPGSYNGASGRERIVGWQKIILACRAGWLAWPSICSICDRNINIHYHVENYLRPIYARPVCRPCHYRLHRRFVEPEPWQLLACRHGGWAATISTAELDRPTLCRLAQKANPEGGLPV